MSLKEVLARDHRIQTTPTEYFSTGQDRRDRPTRKASVSVSRNASILRSSAGMNLKDLFRDEDDSNDGHHVPCPILKVCKELSATMIKLLYVLLAPKARNGLFPKPHNTIATGASICKKSQTAAPT